MQEILIYREACCSQDDQLGSLALRLNFEENASLEQVIQKVLELNFLQYSSSHNQMFGIAKNQKLVEVLVVQKSVNFLVDRHYMIKNLLDEKGLEFYFVNSNRNVIYY